MELLTLYEVARLLCVSESLIRKMVMNKQIETVRIGRVVRFKKETIDELIKTGTTKKEK